jgi:hypothetical protein
MVNQKIKDYTRNVIRFLKERNKQVLLMSHYQIPVEFQEMVDYCIYDNRNHLLYENKYKGWLCYKNNLLYVESQEFYSSNSTLACYYFHSSLFFSKFINKNIVHFIDYDSDLLNLDQYDENYKILKDSEYTSVRYKTTSGDSFENKTLQALFADTSSVNLSKFNLDNLIVSEEKLKNLIENFRTYELFYEIYFLPFEKIYWKSYEEIKKSVSAGLEHVHAIEWVCLASNLQEGKFYLVIVNRSNKNKKYKIIADGHILEPMLPENCSWCYQVSDYKNIIVYDEKNVFLKTYYIPSMNLNDQSKISRMTFNLVGNQL